MPCDVIMMQQKFGVGLGKFEVAGPCFWLNLYEKYRNNEELWAYH